MEPFVEIVKALWNVIPEVGLDAFLVFLLVGLAKLVGVIKQDGQAQLGNLFATYLMSGLEGNLIGFSMTVVVAGGYYHVWKFLKPYLVKAFEFIKQKMS